MVVVSSSMLQKMSPIRKKSPPSPLFGQPLLWTGKKKVSLSSPRNTQTAKLIKQKSIKKNFQPTIETQRDMSFPAEQLAALIRKGI